MGVRGTVGAPGSIDRRASTCAARSTDDRGAERADSRRRCGLAERGRIAARGKVGRPYLNVRPAREIPRASRNARGFRAIAAAESTRKSARREGDA